jgi:glycosyltransferase involved in cell wall biosynthesis
VIRVLHVLPGIARQQGGPALNAIGIARAIRKVGGDNAIFATDIREAASSKTHTRIKSNDLPHEAAGLDVELFRVQWPYRVAYSRDLAVALKKRVRDYDVVHIHSLFLYPQFAAQSIARRRGVPYVVSVHGCLDPALRSRNRILKRLVDLTWQRRMLNSAAGIHFTTNAERDLAADLGYVAPSSVIPNGIEWNSFQISTERTTSCGGEASPRILYLGRLSHKKGLDVLIAALAHLRGQGTDASLVIAGPDDENLSPSLKVLAATLGVSDAVEFTGLLSADDRLAEFRKARVWALPSRTENFGTACIEAMAAGVPVVISPEVNLAAAVEAADAGIVCRSDPAALAGALDRILRDPAEHARLSEAGRSFAQGYDWERVAPSFLNFYASAAEHVIA